MNKSKLIFFKPTDVDDNTNIFLNNTTFGEQPNLIRGGNYSHFFTLPFICTGVLKELSIVYSQGAVPVLTKHTFDLQEDIDNNCSYVRFSLTPEETLLFKSTLQDTYCQLKFTMFGETEDSTEIYFSDPQEILVQSALFPEEE